LNKFQGKTTLLLKTLENIDKYYTPVPSRVVFFYNCKFYFNLLAEPNAYSVAGFQETYAKLQQTLQSKGVVCDFVQGAALTESDIESMADPNGGQTFDD
jgi:hypothetical protein